MAAPEDNTRLIERLLSDAEFRERFRSDPGAAAQEAGIELPEELANGDGGMRTLDGRESKSSFAGALMAAAVEGIGLYELGQHVLPGVEDAQAGTTAPTQEHWDPAEFGQTGTGGSPTPETLDLLNNSKVTFDADGIADLKAGRIDPRVVSVLEAAAEKHRITISAMVSDHDKLTAGGSISNHYYGRAVDIATVDGRPVTPGNVAARQLAVALTRLPASIRPSEIGSPWQLPGAADFSDAAHQNHIHVAFDDPINPNWTPPAGSAEPPTPAAEPVVPAQPPNEDDTEAEDADAASAIVQRAAAAPINPDDLEGNLDDEDGGADEEDGSNEDEPDEGGGEDDDGGIDEEDGGDDEDSGDDSGDDGDGGDEDNGQDAPGEGSNGEDATDDNADGSDNTDNADSSDGDTPESGSSDSSDSSDTGSSGGSGAVDQTPDLGGVDTDYPGDNAPQEQIAAWMASAAEKRGLPPELPVMASLTESSLRNLDYGDADSIGFFQMRTSIWDQGEYAGYGQQPKKQLDWFLDQAEAIKKQRLARGQSVDDPNQYGQWIADVERPAAQYRGRYQLRIEEARKLLGKG
jgi:hypothetical protein